MLYRFSPTMYFLQVKKTERPPPGRRWVRKSAESPTGCCLSGDPPSSRPDLASRVVAPDNRDAQSPRVESRSSVRLLPPTYWKWSPGRRGILDPRNGH